MPRKLRLTPEEKQTLTDCLNTLPKCPVIDQYGNPRTARRMILASTLLEYYDDFKKEGYNIPKKNKLTSDLTQYWGISILEYIDVERRMKRALLAGNLVNEVIQHKADYELFTKRQIELNTPKDLDEPKLTGEEIEKLKRDEADRCDKEQRAAEKRNLGHYRRKRYHK